jgi:cytochrome c2
VMMLEFPAPLLAGAFNPRDGNLYVTGFHIWGSRATEWITFGRVRYTGAPNPFPTAVHTRAQGVVLEFASPLAPEAAANLDQFLVRRWNYRRTERYGSGHYMLSGEPGQEHLPVAGAHLSSDRRSLLLLLPDMREVMQMQVGYALTAEDGRAVRDSVYLTVHSVDELDLAAEGFGAVDWRADLAAAADLDPGLGAPAADPGVATAELGAELFQRIGCIACHSVDGTTDGKLGPSLLGVYGSTRRFTDGSTRTADEAYLRDAIQRPSQQIVEGYQEGMPTYLGVLSDTEIESLILYIRSLQEGSQ